MLAMLSGELGSADSSPAPSSASPAPAPGSVAAPNPKPPAPRVSPTPYDMAAVNELLRDNQTARGQVKQSKALTLTEKMVNACADGKANRPRCKDLMRRVRRAVAKGQALDPSAMDPIAVAETRLKKAKELLVAAEKRVHGLPALVDAVQAAATAASNATKKAGGAATLRTAADKQAIAATAAGELADDDPTNAKAAKAAREATKTAAELEKKAVAAEKETDEVKAEAVTSQKIMERAKAADVAQTKATAAVVAAEKARTDAETAQSSAKAAQGAAAARKKLNESSAQEAITAADEAVRRTSTKAEVDAQAAVAAAEAAETAVEEAEDAAALAEATDESAVSKKKEADDDDKTPAEKELDRLKAGKLIRWGITGGVAPAFYQPLHYAKHAASVPGMGALTYVMMHPGYWRSEPETNIYCANRWGGVASETAAAEAADDLSKERAGLIIERLLASQKAGTLKAGEAKEIMCADGKCVTDDDQVRTLAAKANGDDDDVAEAARTTLTAIVQRSTFSWKSGIAASCGSRMVGMWFGYPLKYTATIPHYNHDGVVVRSRLDARPIFATGLGVSPNAYISLLFGIALSKVNLPPGTDKDDELVVSFLFGLGGNLDLLGFLTK